MKIIKALILLTLGLSVQPSAWAVFYFKPSEVLIVSSVNSSINKLDEHQIKYLFLGQLSKLSNGNNVEIVELVNEHPLRQKFHSSSTGKTESELQRDWRRLTFTGKKKLPLQFQSVEQVISYLGQNPNAIGYIDSASFNRSLKILHSY